MFDVLKITCGMVMWVARMRVIYIKNFEIVDNKRHTAHM